MVWDSVRVIMKAHYDPSCLDMAYIRYWFFHLLGLPCRYTTPSILFHFKYQCFCLWGIYFKYCTWLLNMIHFCDCTFCFVQTVTAWLLLLILPVFLPFGPSYAFAFNMIVWAMHSLPASSGAALLKAPRSCWLVQGQPQDEAKMAGQRDHVLSIPHLWHQKEEVCQQYQPYQSLVIWHQHML